MEALVSVGLLAAAIVAIIAAVALAIAFLPLSIWLLVAYACFSFNFWLGVLFIVGSLIWAGNR